MMSISYVLHQNSTMACLTCFYVQPVNQWDKTVDPKGFEVTGIQNKVELILDSSGMKIKHIKGSRVVESTMEGARGIWSGLHVDVPFKI